MKEIRLTFRAEDFGAVSQALIAIGIGFRVEPVDEAPAESVAEPPQPVLKRRAAKKTAKAAIRKSPPRGESLLTGADRLRSALARKTADMAPSTPPADAGDARPSPSGDNGM